LITDPQSLPFLDPKTHDFTFEIQPTDSKGDGAKSLKLVFESIGEIDFIVGGSLTSTPTKSTTVEGEVVQLETIPEIITKKSIIVDQAYCRVTSSTSRREATRMRLRLLAH